jgi:carboxylesterase
MAPGDSDPRNLQNGSDDEQELINAEFEAMVSGLNLDQSSPSTYLDELEEI